jgi:hypothetical protein
MVKMLQCKCGEKANVIIDGDGFMVTVLIRCKCGKRLVKWFVDDGKIVTKAKGVAMAVQEWNSGKAVNDV